MTSSNRERRIDRLLPTLSAKERALLALRRWKEHKEPDRQLVNSVPQAQAAEYNRYIGMMRAAGGDLSYYIAVVHGLIGQLDLRCAWLMTMLLWSQNVEDLTPHLRDRRVAAVRRALTEAPLRAFEDPKSEVAERSMDSVGRALMDTIAKGVHDRWQELRAVDIVLAEFSENLNDEDLLHAEVRELWEDGMRRLEDLAEQIADLGIAVTRDEPSIALVDQLRAIAKYESQR